MGFVLYLHGFASSPRSRKAEFFSGIFRSWGWSCAVPDMNEPSFSTLTLSRSIGRILDEAGRPSRDAELVLMGSSFGGLAAAQAAARLGGRVRALVLMAPAFGAAEIWEGLLGRQGLEEWRRRGWQEVEHPAYGEPQPLFYAFYEDLLRQETEPPRVSCPALVLHGSQDEVVPPRVSRIFGERNPEARVCFLSDGHDLLGSLEDMAQELERFFRGIGLLRGG